MRQAYIFTVLLLAASSAVLSGCYTQLAGDEGGYYGYGRRVYRAGSERSDTIQTASQMRYDTTMKGDTMFIEEHPVTSSASDGSAPANGGGEEIVSNYYDDGSYWPYYWPPSPAFAVSFGWPYRSWYNDCWSANYGWDYWGYPGFYPPVFDVYAPFYGFGFGYGIYNHGFYGGGFGRFAYGGYGHGYGGYDRYGYGRSAYGGYPYGGIGRGASGIGEARSVALGGSRGGLPTSIGIQNRQNGIASYGERGLSSSVGRQSVAESRMSEISGDRNSPVHAVAPEANSSMSRNQGASSSAASGHQVVVRQSADGTRTINSGGRSVVVVRRGASSGQASRSYGPSGRSSGGYGSRSYGGRGSSSSSGRGSYGGGRSSGNSGRSSGGGGGSSRSSGGGGGGGRGR